MLKTVKDACTLSADTMDYQAAGGVESLTEVLFSDDQGAGFFNRSYTTEGMRELASEGLMRLAGQSDQALFELSQAMGGGKTHLLAALGLAALYPGYRPALVQESKRERVGQERASVAVFDGRDMPEHYLWGEIAAQLGDEAYEAFRKFWQNGPRAPGKSDWKAIIGETPTLILFDELPPYFKNAHSVTVGNATLADVLTTALSNLFAAALELDRCCIVLANLADSYANQIKNIREIVGQVHEEAKRQARQITPVSMEGDEIYQILRKRLFTDIPEMEDIDETAEAFAAQIKRAEDEGYLTARSLDQIEEEVRLTYPFHPSYKHLVALFRDNPGFRETRGLLQFTARLLRSVWQREQNDVYLVGTQHLDASDALVADELHTVNASLRNALARDVADQGGSAHAEAIDSQHNSDAGSQVATLLFAASLSQAVRGHAGLRREEVIEYLIAPNRKPDEFSKAFDALRKTAWYLHSDGDLVFFKDTENLTKRIQKESEQVAQARIDKALAHRLGAELEPRSKLAYQRVYVMPDFAEVQLSTQRALLVVKPDNSVPPEAILNYYASLEEKNHLLVLTGDSTYVATRLEHSLRELIAVESIRKSATVQHSESLREEIEQAHDAAEQGLNQALQSTFNRLLFPGAETLETATIPNGLHFGQTDERRAERQIEELLSSMACDEKLVGDLEEPDGYLAMAEHHLWPSGNRFTQWRDVLLRAKTDTAWPWMPGGKGMEALRAEAQARGRWRVYDDGRIEKGPFPPEKTTVNVIPLDVDMHSGESILEVVAKNAGAEPVIHFADHPGVSETDPVVDHPTNFRTDRGTLHFLAIDPRGKHETGEPARWVARLKVQHAIHRHPQSRSVELKCTPSAHLRYTIDGTNPREGTPYTQAFSVPDGGCTVLVYAELDEASAQESFRIPAASTKEGGEAIERAHIEPTEPVDLVRSTVHLDDTAKVFELLSALRGRSVDMHGVRIELGRGEHTVLVRLGENAITPDMLAGVIDDLRARLKPADEAVSVRISDRIHFAQGHDLQRLAEIAGLELTAERVERQG